MKTLSARLSELDKLAKQIDDYNYEMLSKVQIFCYALLNEGVSVANQNLGNFGKYIQLTQRVDRNQYGCDAVMVATNTGIIHSTWVTKEGEKSADVSPLLMCEFGSGMYAENPKGVAGVGQGTFPNQTHAGDANGWWWATDDGSGKLTWHHSNGVRPSAPMYKAFEHMLLVATSTAQRVFN